MTGTVKKKPSSKRFFSFFGDVKEELKKVSWTPREELKLNTKVVVSATLFFGLLIYFMDLGIYNLLNLVSKLAKIIGG